MLVVEVCVCLPLSLIIIAYSVSLTQHSAERAQSTVWVIPADPGSAFNPTLHCTEEGEMPRWSELRSARSQHWLWSQWSYITHALTHIQQCDYITILIRTFHQYKVKPFLYKLNLRKINFYLIKRYLITFTHKIKLKSNVCFFIV